MREISNHKANKEVLNQLIESYEETIEEYNNNVRDIRQYQSNAQQSTTQTLDLDDVDLADANEAHTNIQAIKTFWNGMVEADNAAESAFSDAESSIRKLQNKIDTFLDAIGMNGGKVGSLDMDQLNSAVFADQKMLDFIREKLTDGEKLNYAERELLYLYLQNEFFDEEDHAKMNEISIFMEHDTEQLTEYINEEVLASEASLNEEISRLELYLFNGNNRPSYQHGSPNDRIKLNSYLTLLKNYRTAINEVREPMDWDRSINDPLLARVEFIHFEFEDSPINGHTESNIIIDYHQETGGRHGITREEYIELDPVVPFGRQNASEVNYYYGPDAVSDLKERHKLDLEDELETYTGEFIATELLGLALTGPASTVFGTIQTLGGYQQGLDENRQRLTFERLEQTAIDFNLELQVNNRHVPGHSENIQVQLIPTEESFNVIDRWNAIHQLDADYPYPATEIGEQDWAGLNEFLYDDGNKADMKTDEVDRAIYYYIIEGTESDHPVVQDAIERLDD